MQTDNDEALDTIWMMLAGILVFFMHAGKKQKAISRCISIVYTIVCSEYAGFSFSP